MRPADPRFPALTRAGCIVVALLFGLSMSPGYAFGGLPAGTATTGPIHVVQGRGAIRISIDGSALFGTSAQALRAGSDKVLERVLPIISKSSGPVVVIGFNRAATDQTPGAGWRRRARAVAAWLHVHGRVPLKRLRIKAPSVVRSSGRPAPMVIVITVKLPKSHA